MRKFITIIAVLFIGLYLLVGRGQWFSEIERQVIVGRDRLFSENIDIGKKGIITWKVPRDEWSYEEGEARLSILLDRLPNLSAEKYHKENSPLKLKVNDE